MLAWPYLCTKAGLAFVNAPLIITDRTSRECLSMSLFSE
jgi:hypothetical protein